MDGFPLDEIRRRRYEAATDPVPDAFGDRIAPFTRFGDAVDQWTGEVWPNLDRDELLDWVERGRNL